MRYFNFYDLKILKNKFLFRFIFIIKSRKTFKKPSKIDLLIYDGTYPEVLIPYLKKYNYSVLFVRGESLNLHILIKSIFTKSFWLVNPFYSYTLNYIKTVSPKVILTYIDNKSDFYKLSKDLPHIKTVFIQNGSRSVIGDVFDSVKSGEFYQVDFMLVHNEAIGKKYQDFIQGESISIGSFLLNLFQDKIDIIPNRIAFISQIRKQNNKSKVFFYRPNGSPIYWDEFYQAEIFNIKFLSDWCNRNKKNLLIIGSQKEDSVFEKNFYSNIIGEENFQFIPKTDLFSSYRMIMQSEIVVFIDSTLGYESYGLGKKTASFSNRKINNSPRNTFGWPADFKERGLFWTNYQDENDLEGIMNFLNVVSDKEWSKILKDYSSKLMVMDSGNTKLERILESLLSRDEGHNIY
jgi:surface carbohydrate biosynthesis protein